MLTPIREIDGPQTRQATPHDAERLVDVLRNAYRKSRQLGYPAKAETATVDDIHEWLDGGRLYIAESESEVIGAFRIKETTPEQLEINRLGAHEDWQGHGAGSALLDDVEHLARAEDIETVWLTTPRGPPIPPDTLSESGLQRDQRLSLAYRAYDEVVMAKPLDEI